MPTKYVFLRSDLQLNRWIVKTCLNKLNKQNKTETFNQVMPPIQGAFFDRQTPSVLAYCSSLESILR
jgi:hypothetical protein